MKGTRQGRQFGRHSRGDAMAPHQWRRGRFLQPFPKGNRQVNATQAVQGRHLPEREMSETCRGASGPAAAMTLL